MLSERPLVALEEQTMTDTTHVRAKSDQVVIEAETEKRSRGSNPAIKHETRLSDYIDALPPNLRQDNSAQSSTESLEDDNVAFEDDAETVMVSVSRKQGQSQWLKHERNKTRKAAHVPQVERFDRDDTRPCNASATVNGSSIGSEHMSCKSPSGVESKPLKADALTQREVQGAIMLHEDSQQSSSLGGFVVQPQVPCLKQPMKPEREELIVSTARDGINLSQLQYATEESSIRAEAVQFEAQLPSQDSPVLHHIATDPTPRKISPPSAAIKHQDVASSLCLPPVQLSQPQSSHPKSLAISETKTILGLQMQPQSMLTERDPDPYPVPLKNLQQSQKAMSVSSEKLLPQSQGIQTSIDDQQMVSDQINAMSIHALSEATELVQMKKGKQTSTFDGPKKALKKHKNTPAHTITAQSQVEKSMLKFKPSMIKGVKSISAKKSECKSQALPSTQCALKSKHIMSAEKPSEFTEVLFQAVNNPVSNSKANFQQQLVTEYGYEGPSTQNSQVSTDRNAHVDGVIRHLNSLSKNKSIATNSATSGQIAATFAFQSKSAQSPNQSRLYGDNSTIFKSGKQFWDRSMAEEKSQQMDLATTMEPRRADSGSPIAAILKDHPTSSVATDQATPLGTQQTMNAQGMESGRFAKQVETRRHDGDDAKTQCTVEDWRAGVHIKFAVTGTNKSSIQLVQNGDVIDTKSIAVSLSTIARNYDVDNLQHFCKEWIMPCITIKTHEWITAELHDVPHNKEELYLQVHGEMLSELIFKQFKIAESRPASAFTLAPYRDNQDEARFYTQDLSQMEETPSKEENFLTEDDQEIPLQLFDVTKEKVSEHDYRLLSASDNATTAPAPLAVSQQLGTGRLPLARFATQIEKKANDKDEDDRKRSRPYFSTKNKSVSNDL